MINTHYLPTPTGTTTGEYWDQLGDRRPELRPLARALQAMGRREGQAPLLGGRDQHGRVLVEGGTPLGDEGFQWYFVAWAWGPDDDLTFTDVGLAVTRTQDILVIDEYRGPGLDALAQNLLREVCR